MSPHHFQSNQDPQSKWGNLRDENFNKLVSTGNPIMILLGIFMKFGMTPVACIYMAWIIHQKDLQIDSYNSQLVQVVSSMQKAITESTEQNRALGKLIEANTWAVNRVKRESLTPN